MQTILEIFYLRIFGKQLRYQRKQVDLTRKGRDPEKKIQALIREERVVDSGKVEKNEFLVHSTSWRYEEPDKVVLTYVAYSDELKFKRGTVKRLPLKSLRTITKKSRRPRSRAELEKKVVSHAMRHLAFLIQTDGSIDVDTAVTPETKRVFEQLWVSLAGQVL